MTERHKEDKTARERHLLQSSNLLGWGLVDLEDAQPSPQLLLLFLQRVELPADRLDALEGLVGGDIGGEGSLGSELLHQVGHLLLELL